jgi:quinol monooxygenase YgiN
MILVIIKIKTLPAKRNEFLQTVCSLLQPIRMEKGCINCFASQDIEDQNIFHLIENWNTQQDLDNHIRSDLFTVLLGSKNLMSEPLDIKFKVVSYTAGMEAVKAARSQTSQG